MAQRRTSRPDYSWSNFGDVESGVDISTATGQFGTTASAVVLPQTLTRTRGRVSMTLNPAAVNETLTLLCGLVVVNSDALSGDAPEIFTAGDDEASWIWQGSLYVDSGNETAVNENFLSDSVQVDSKAMRKLKPGNLIAFVFHVPAALRNDQGGTYKISYYFHCLNQQ